MSILKTTTTVGVPLTVTNTCVNEGFSINKDGVKLVSKIATSTATTTASATWMQHHNEKVLEEMKYSKNYIESMSTEELSAFYEKLAEKEQELDLNIEEGIVLVKK